MKRRTITLAELIRHYDVFNRSEGKSPATGSFYNEKLTNFIRYLESQGIEPLLDNVGIANVRAFIRYLQEKPKWKRNPGIHTETAKLSPATVHAHVRALRAFYAWLHREGYTKTHLLADLKPPKVPKKLIKILIREEIGRILACVNTNTQMMVRDRAIIMLMYDTGIRSSELADAMLENLDLEGGSLKVMGKGGKERLLPLGHSVRKILQRYVFHFRQEPIHPMVDNLFLAREGQPLSSNAIKLMFERLSHRSGVERLHAHLLRHTFATNYLINGGDVFSLQQILGHTTLEMVRHYVTLASAHVTIQHRRFSPMDYLALQGLQGRNGSRFTPGASSNVSKNGNGHQDQSALPYRI